eukprot:scaffold1610_cov257-Pinguiococcus_pyrenoidosus.AAC.13
MTLGFISTPAYVLLELPQRPKLYDRLRRRALRSLPGVSLSFSSRLRSTGPTAPPAPAFEAIACTSASPPRWR